MKTHTFNRGLIALAALATLGVGGADAAQYTIAWNGSAGDNAWSTAGNWNSGIVPNNNDDDTYIAEITVLRPSATPISIGTPIVVDQIKFLRDPNLVLGTPGQQITLTGGSNGIGLISTDASYAANTPDVGPTIAANIVLAPTPEAGGFIRFTPAVSNSPSGNAPRGVAITGVISGDAGILKVGNAAVELAGVNTYTGETRIQQNWIYVASDAPNGAPGALGHSTSAVQLGTAQTANADTGLVTRGAVTIGRDIVANVTGSGTTFLGGASTQTNATSVYTGTITLNRSIQVVSWTQPGYYVDFQGQITGTGGLLKRQAGYIRLSNPANNYTGQTTVRGGYVLVGATGALGSATSAIVVGENTTTSHLGLLTDGQVVIDRNINVTSAGDVNAVPSLGGSATQYESSRFTGNISIAKTTVLQSYTSAGHAVSFEGTISGAAGLRIAGPGTVRLIGTNTYAGATQVGADGLGGTLIIEGSHTGGGAYTVAAGAALAGNGSIVTGQDAAGLTVADGAIFAPDGFDVTGDLRLAGTLLAGRVDVGGTLTIDPTAVLDLSGIPELNETDGYVLASYGQLVGKWDTSRIVNLPAGAQINYAYEGNQIAVVVPEPAGLISAALVAVPVLLRRRHGGASLA